MIDDNLHWLLSYYRSSEIAGALFFGNLARIVGASSFQAELTRQFAEEAQHANYWTQCMAQLGVAPLKLRSTYQDQYIDEAGTPANIMEVLAITQVFEKRVIGQYARHRRTPGLPQEVKDTLDAIIKDEKWHITWITQALESLEERYGRELIASTLDRFEEADREVYRRTIHEHKQRLDELTLATR